MVGQWHCSHNHQNHYAYAPPPPTVVVDSRFFFWDEQEARIFCSRQHTLTGKRPRVRMANKFVRFEALSNCQK